MTGNDKALVIDTMSVNWYSTERLLFKEKSSYIMVSRGKGGNYGS